jgi:chemotaxis protein CheD
MTVTTEQVNLGQILVTQSKGSVFEVANIGSSLVVVLYDRSTRIGGLAHIVLPDSTMSEPGKDKGLAGKYANQAIPLLFQQFMDAGGQKLYTTVRLVGGAQMFNFGGGGGNPLNVGSRNAIAVRAALSKTGLAIEKADVGGNKIRNLRFIIESGYVIVSQLGGREYAV